MGPSNQLIGAGMLRVWYACLVILISGGSSFADPELVGFERQRDVIYGRKLGTCLTMDVFTPQTNAKGVGVVVVVSGGWVSNHDAIAGLTQVSRLLLQRGYTLFAVVHGSQPKFTVPECVEDMHRAVRFIRANAGRFGIDPERIGVMGASAGCHLSLMLAVGTRDGDPKAKDPVDRVSSRVQAAAGFFPPTDFLNYGESGKDGYEFLLSRGFAAPFDFRELDPRKGWLPVSAEKRRELMRQVSPTQLVTEQTAPVLLIHGDKDELVPIQQSQIFLARAKEKNVPCDLVVRPGAAHGWPGIARDVALIADWFDRYLVKKTR
jgi:acetyl esterase/lipase